MVGKFVILDFFYLKYWSIKTCFSMTNLSLIAADDNSYSVKDTRFHYKYQTPMSMLKIYKYNLSLLGNGSLSAINWYLIMMLLMKITKYVSSKISFILLVLYFLNYLISRIQLQCGF
jgi:hypothetical protein